MSSVSSVADETATGGGAAKTPHDEYFDRRTAWMNEHKDISGAILVKGISRSNDSEDESESDDEENDDTSKYTTEQMNSLRVIMITKNRSEQHEKMGRLILGDQYGDSFKMFNTSFSYDVLDSWQRVKGRLSKMTPSEKFDALLAYTHTLKQYDVWMHDNEGGMDVLVKGLATVWRNLLKKSDDEIGWDLEYTKPGTLELLRQFKEEVEGTGVDYYDMGKFNYE
jgi:hypothetical protein